MSTWTFKSAKGRRWHSSALLYVLLAYSAGWWCLLSGGWPAFLPGVLLLRLALSCGQRARGNDFHSPELS